MIVSIPLPRIWAARKRNCHLNGALDHGYLVTSTYEPPLTALHQFRHRDRKGNPIAAAKRYGTVAFAEADLNEQSDHK
jgi:hypothetical protein